MQSLAGLSGRGEGKTTFLTNLSLTIAQTGAKVLCISSDLRRPTVAKSFGLDEHNGFIELLTGTITLDQAIRSVSDLMLGAMPLEDIVKTPGIENLYILPSGHSRLNPAEILNPRDIQNLNKQLRTRFDFILYDSPPVLPVTDASILAPHMDALIIVYETGRTSKEALLRTKVQLVSIGAKIMGIVLNNAKPNTEALTTYPYYYRQDAQYCKRSILPRMKWQRHEKT